MVASDATTTTTTTVDIVHVTLPFAVAVLAFALAVQLVPSLLLADETLAVSFLALARVQVRVRGGRSGRRSSVRSALGVSRAADEAALVGASASAPSAGSPNAFVVTTRRRRFSPRPSWLFPV